MKQEEIKELIKELETWHRIREHINQKPNRKNRLNLDTLPRVISILKQLL